jgi:uncharacterized protein involved in exopolysaccharide biosynthesis
MPTEPTNQNQYPDPMQRPYHEDEIDLVELFMVLWAGKRWIIGTTFIAAVISVAVALWLPNIYRAEAVLAADEGGGALSSLAAQYGGLASLAGISLPTDSSSEKAVGIETLKSRQFVIDFIERRNILPELMAAKRYSWETGELSYDKNIYDFSTQTWTRKAKAPYQPKPSPLEAYEEFMEIYAVNEDRETGFVTISIEHPSPVLVQQWVTWLVEDINEKMMTKATNEAQQSIDFLNEQLKKTQVVALQDVFYSLIEEQTKTIMLAKVRQEYLFETIDPAVAPEEEVKPMRALICIVGTFLGGLFSAIAVLLLHYLPSKIRPAA